MPLEGSAIDSVQLFSMYGDTRGLETNEWGVGFKWRKDRFLGQEHDRPDEILIDLQTRSHVNLEYLQLGISMRDTSSGILGFSWNNVNIVPDWQIFHISWLSTDLEHIHKINLTFFMYGADSTYIGLEVLLNNLRFVYIDTVGGNIVKDTVLIDNFGDDGPNSVEPISGTPTGFILHQNYPNPFNPTTKIRYEISELTLVNLTIYDLLGQKITTLVDEELSAGVYETPFDGTGLSSGTYIAVLSINVQRVQTRKMTLMK